LPWKAVTAEILQLHLSATQAELALEQKNVEVAEEMVKSSDGITNDLFWKYA